VSRIVSARERAETSERPPGFDLGSAWAERSEAFERGRPQVEVTVRVPGRHVRFLRAARVIEEGEPPTVVASFDGLDRAFYDLLSYGPQAEVIAPIELRERIARAARETAALYAGVAGSASPDVPLR
jgi:predicted DNA-binding transcriptional regulator YafY